MPDSSIRCDEMTSEDASDPGNAPAGRQPSCPICGKARVEAVRPFCSPRCREIDLGRWLSGSYVIAGGRTDEDGEQAPRLEAEGPGSDDAADR